MVVLGDELGVDVPPKYDYTWKVSDGYANVNYGQKEARDGANTVGSYFVLLPDGRYI